MSRLIDVFHSIFVYPFRFKSFGKRSKIVSPMTLRGERYMEVGNNVYVAHSAYMAVDTRYPGYIRIEDGCHIGHLNHIVSASSIVIEKDVLTADRVTILDASHQYCDITLPIVKQPLEKLRQITIGEGSWIGENVCVLSASIGKHCVIGANSVVIEDIPDYSVAVGAPARVIKQYDSQTKSWKKV